MGKILNHFKNNAIIYLILLLCLVILAIAIFVKQQNKVEVDTSMFNVIPLKEAIGLFDDNDPKYILISTNDCAATEKFVPSLVIAEAKEEVKVYYLELNDIDRNNKEDLEDFFKFQELLDFEYTFRGETKPIGEFIGNTPMNVVIKNKKVVWAYIGSMSTEAARAVLKRYLK